MASLLELTGGFVSPRILSAISRPEMHTSRPEMHTSRPEVPEPVPLQNLSQNLDKSRVNLENLEVLETAACRASPAPRKRKRTGNPKLPGAGAWSGSRVSVCDSVCV